MAKQLLRASQCVPFVHPSEATETLACAQAWLGWVVSGFLRWPECEENFDRLAVPERLFR
jgi:hypothetical protein